MKKYRLSLSIDQNERVYLHDNEQHSRSCRICLNWPPFCRPRIHQIDVMDGFCTHHAIFPLDLLTWSQQWREGTVSCDVYGIQVVYFSQNFEFKCAFCGIQVCVLWNSSLRFVEFKFASKESSFRFVEFKFAFLRIQVCVFENSSLRFWEFKFTSLTIQVCVLWNSSLRFAKFKFAFCGIQVCIERIKFSLCRIQVFVF